jgi:hypothetical protein
MDELVKFQCRRFAPPEAGFKVRMEEGKNGKSIHRSIFQLFEITPKDIWGFLL